ncbi:cellulose-binding protein, partial [Streptomyces sp. SID9727]|nr:cellulose-binding protein [Streptomyces sp. SID9727]
MDRAVAALSAERDEAVARVARLTELAEELAAESARLDEAVARLAPPDYAPLGERALRILELAEEEAGALLGAAREEAQAFRDEADA